MNRHDKLKLTLADLVAAVQDLARSDDEVIAVLAHMVRTGQILRAAPALR